MASKHFSAPNLLRKHFPGKSPMQVELDAREALRETLEQKLAGMQYVSVDKPRWYNYQRKEDRVVCDLSIDFPSGYSSPKFKLDVNDDNILNITYNNTNKLVSSLEELIALAADCQAVAEERYIKSAKQKKIRNLKEQTILTKVKQLAKEERFSYRLEPGTFRFTLYIKMEDTDVLIISIPYDKFQETAPLIRTAILSMRNLYQEDVRFQLKRSRHGWYGSSWVTPEMLDKE